jgi:hypothetical protein
MTFIRAQERCHPGDVESIGGIPHHLADDARHPVEDLTGEMVRAADPG